MVYLANPILQPNDLWDVRIVNEQISWRSIFMAIHPSHYSYLKASTTCKRAERIAGNKLLMIPNKTTKGNNKVIGPQWIV